MATRTSFYKQNPKTYAAVIAALGDATNYINDHKREAVEAYVKITGDKGLSIEGLIKLTSTGRRVLADPQIT